MAATSWMRYPNSRYGRSQKGRYHNKEDDINFDIKSDPRQNVTNILSILCQRGEISDGKRLNYLNAFVKLTLHIAGNFEEIGFQMGDILCCLRITLLHSSTQIRAGGLRAIRHILRHEDDIKALNHLLIPFLIARSLDLVLRNDVERIEAMKLIRKMLLLSPLNFHISLARSLVSLANSGAEEKDRLLRICLATLCELGVVNTTVFIETGGVAAITRNLLECQTPKIAESLCGILLLLLDKPETRCQANVDLHSIAAPYCDFHYRHDWKDKDKYLDERELRFNCSRLALLSILRSWPGVLHFCGPSNNAGLKAVVNMLYLNQLEVRKAVLDLLYELLGLPQPEWTDELSVALSAIDPCEPQSAWRLNEGFIASEGRSILPHLAKTTPCITDMHLSLLLYSFLECGLLAAIVEVIATSDTFISVRGTVLLGQLLHLIQFLLPPECCNISPALPTLLEYASNGNPQAVKAVNGLQQLHKLLKSRPASYSIHLDFILRSGGNVKSLAKNSKKRRRLKSLRVKFQQLVGQDGDDVIKETGVLLNKDAYTWNWNLIRIILKGESLSIDLNETTHRNFMKRLVDFYSPSSNRFSHMDLTSTKISTAYTLTGLDLVTYLLDLSTNESQQLLLELFTDITEQIRAITSGRSVHDCLFSPQHMNSTQCQSYFIFIGRLTSNENGYVLLNQLEIYQKLTSLATTTNNDCYVKLIVSSLDYSSMLSQDLLESVLQCSIESTRLYATQFLLVLLRGGITDFHDWGVKYLVKQLNDQSRSVFLTALNILHEACELDNYLRGLVKLAPDFSQFGEKGELISIRMLSLEEGFKLVSRDFLLKEIQKWDNHMNFSYIKLVEGETSDVLTLHQRDEDGKYDKRSTTVRCNNRRDFFLPPHLYGQLARHTEGFLLLVQHGSLDKMLLNLNKSDCESDDDIVRLKATLWALGHFGSTIEGLSYLILHNCLILMVELAQNSLVMSIRATAYYILGLIATTKNGADELYKFGWFTTRHNRHVSWPIIDAENWDDENDSLKSGQLDTPTLYFLDKDFDGSDTTDSLTGLPDVSIISPQKSLTLPANQTIGSGHHQRSLSESKTFDIIRLPSDLRKIDNRRIRNNSTTESTTSGVSSCDSVGGGRSIIYERQQNLSPIPSSCSLHTLKQGGQKVRRHSESSRRVSVQSGAFQTFSHQDLVGYATLRAVRKSPRYLEEPEYESSISESTWDVSVSLIEDFHLLDPSLKRQSVQSNLTDGEGRIYMGITLPHDILQLFLEDDIQMKAVSIDKFPIIEDEVVNSLQDLKFKEETQWVHNTEMCLKCLGSSENIIFTAESIDDSCDSQTTKSYAKGKILQLADQFSNPVWCKQVKQALLRHKQDSPHLFQDICLYSEVCKMLSQCSYRLSPRRMLHELFLDINFDYLYSACDDIINEKMAASAPTIKLDSLNLSYKQNKFPIRKRNESKIV